MKSLNVIWIIVNDVVIIYYDGIRNTRDFNMLDRLESIGSLSRCWAPRNGSGSRDLAMNWGTAALPRKTRPRDRKRRLRKYELGLPSSA